MPYAPQNNRGPFNKAEKPAEFAETLDSHTQIPPEDPKSTLLQMIEQQYLTELGVPPGNFKVDVFRLQPGRFRVNLVTNSYKKDDLMPTFSRPDSRYVKITLDDQIVFNPPITRKYNKELRKPQK